MRGDSAQQQPSLRILADVACELSRFLSAEVDAPGFAVGAFCVDERVCVRTAGEGFHEQTATAPEPERQIICHERLGNGMGDDRVRLCQRPARHHVGQRLDTEPGFDEEIVDDAGAIVQLQQTVDAAVACPFGVDAVVPVGIERQQEMPTALQEVPQVGRLRRG